MRLLCLLALCVLLPVAVAAQDVQSILQNHAQIVAKPSRKTVSTVIDALVASGLPQVPEFLERYQARDVFQHEDGRFVYADSAGDGYRLRDIDTGAEMGTAPKDALTQIKPNGGVRRVLAGALVVFQLSAPEIERRRTALDAIARKPSADHLEPLRATIDTETDPALKARKQRLVNSLTAQYGADTGERIAAIEGLAQDVSVESRAVLSRIVQTTAGIAPELPDANIARVFEPGQDMTAEAAYLQLVDAGLAPAALTSDDIRNTLAANIDGGTVAGVPVARLSDPSARAQAYDALAASGDAPPRITEADKTQAIAAYRFFETYDEPNPEVTAAAETALAQVQTRVAVGQTIDLTLDALSLASIYFLAAIGLAVTFGVMGVINMAHGEFIMLGAYTGYVVQLFVPDYTLSLVIALPLAFAVAFGAGVAMERLVIRWLYHRPLETLLATFGISIALQQLAKTIFGTQARPLTAPGWLDGALVINEVIQISYIRIAIFVLALIFLALLLFIFKRTRLGLEVRAVTQNPKMAASMGINPDRINMLTFGLGSGIAGIAGVAIGLYAQVTSEMGANYIVQSFMTVVVGGVGNVWGTLAGASMIGGLQKGIEWFNPSNTLAAQTYMIIFIIIFIQFRPRGIIALKGRAAGD
ncbi:urea ABC transporter permease subunit UrtB [Aliishimia ponticola]|uniref:Urea ABC transporter permease subunit UrtB n=1 Tax=Aliishimia ponticola TaxID=2499833 RepID=A0A4S4NJM4_9RHOB|nr:urea ABC transporter permease subunit UrtB [Aliishimia ponticola]THH38468.1 urea ABC transporter permease subunit UrtB [Aliishimia ponticola]